MYHCFVDKCVWLHVFCSQRGVQLESSRHKHDMICAGVFEHERQHITTKMQNLNWKTKILQLSSNNDSGGEIALYSQVTEQQQQFARDRETGTGQNMKSTEIYTATRWCCGSATAATGNSTCTPLHLCWAVKFNEWIFFLVLFYYYYYII